MARVLLAIVILLHGSIHVMGFAKAFHYAEIPQLKNVSKTGGVLWLIAALLFVSSAVLLLWKSEYWWLVSAFAIVLSQFLIVRNWSDAKFGTLANFVILLPAVVACGEWNFQSMVSRAVREFTLPGTSTSRMVTQERIASLPDPVRKWLRQSNIAGRETIHTVSLKQSGRMRTTQNGRWMRFTAVQYDTVDRPGFLWSARVTAAPFLHLSGRDKYENGKGHMLIRFLSLIPVVDSSGPQIDQGALVRYLAEIVWFPTAALSNYITWEEVDATTARANISEGDVTASCLFFFSPAGDVKELQADRFYSRKNGATLEKWQISMDPDGFQEFAGMRIPTRSAVTWKLKEGDFTWLELEVRDIVYDAR